jgi:hypothetical protein
MLRILILLSVLYTTVFAGLSTKAQNLILKLHNKERSEVVPTASNMLEMEWDPVLASVAQDFADQCLGGTNDLRSHKYLEYFVQKNNSKMIEKIGDPDKFLITELSQFLHGSNKKIKDVMENFVSGKKYWNYYQSKCLGAGHCHRYIKTIWANADRVGCGSKLCPEVFTRSGGYPCEQDGGCVFLACYYLPGSLDSNPEGPDQTVGELLSDLIYSMGTPCSQCPSHKPYCKNNLCSANPPESEQETQEASE